MNLTKKTKNELIEEARSLGIRGVSSMNKKDIIKEIKRHDKPLNYYNILKLMTDEEIKKVSQSIREDLLTKYETKNFIDYFLDQAIVRRFPKTFKTYNIDDVKRVLYFDDCPEIMYYMNENMTEYLRDPNKLIIDFTKMNERCASFAKFTDDALIYFTAAVEFICAELLELAGRICIKYKKIKISEKHIMDAVEKDHELKQLLIKT